jgi:cytochrome c5
MHKILRAIFIAGLCATSLVESLAWMQARRGQGSPMEPSKPLNPVEVEQGEELYNSSCTMCHGLKGTVGDRAPALAANRRYRRATDSALYDAIKNGIVGTLMPPSPSSTEKALNRWALSATWVIAWGRWLRPKPEITSRTFHPARFDQAASSGNRRAFRSFRVPGDGLFQVMAPPPRSAA